MAEHNSSPMTLIRRHHIRFEKPLPNTDSAGQLNPFAGAATTRHLYRCIIIYISSGSIQPRTRVEQEILPHLTLQDIIRPLDLSSLTPCNFMPHSLVKLFSTPQQIPEATQGLLHFEGSIEQYSAGANRVSPFF